MSTYQGKSKLEYRSIFISDVHLGTKSCKDEKLLDFMSVHKAQNWYLNGDILDLWSLQRKHVWNKTQTEILRKILKLSEKSDLYFIPGNHDEVIRKFIAYNNGLETFGSVKVSDHVDYVDLYGNRVLVTHGDSFDYSMRVPSWLHSQVDRVLGWVPVDRIPGVEKFVNKFTSTETAAKSYIQKNKHRYDCILIGHTHVPKLALPESYMNCGDWVKNCSYIVETLNGQWMLKYWDEKHE